MKPSLTSSNSKEHLVQDLEWHVESSNTMDGSRELALLLSNRRVLTWLLCKHARMTPNLVRLDRFKGGGAIGCYEFAKVLSVKDLSVVQCSHAKLYVRRTASMDTK